MNKFRRPKEADYLMVAEVIMQMVEDGDTTPQADHRGTRSQVPWSTMTSAPSAHIASHSMIPGGILHLSTRSKAVATDHVRDATVRGFIGHLGDIKRGPHCRLITQLEPSVVS